MLEKSLRRPAHQLDRIVPGEASDVDEPDERLNAGSGPDTGSNTYTSCEVLPTRPYVLRFGGQG